MRQAVDHENVLEANAMNLATVDSNGKPHSRFVLLKDFNDEKAQFTWFTNYNSNKGKELEANPHAALTFYWEAIDKQVRVQGTVSKLSEQDSTDYFNKRPRGAQIGAWSSDQSAVIES